jgi:transposase
MEQSPLFALPKAEVRPASPPTMPEHARVLRPNRQQIEWAPRDLDAVLAANHPARAIWALLEKLNLDAFYGSVKAVLDGPGRPPSDPRVLLALWVLAISENVGSARQLARLCEEHDAYRWLRGGVPINYHMLADFRVVHQTALDELLSQIIAALMAAGAVTLDQVAQDGMRVRASAGGSSYRRRESLEAYLGQARARVQALAAAREHPDPGLNRRQLAARERAAREQLARAEQALALMPELEAIKDKQRQKRGIEGNKVRPAQASTTDPEARLMMMADRGFRPGYNLQLATDAQSGIIVGVAVIASGEDAGQAGPMEAQVRRRTGQAPRAYLVDGGYVSRADITSLEQRGVAVYAPVRPSPRQPQENLYKPRYGDSPEVAAWRARMSTEAAQARVPHPGRNRRMDQRPAQTPRHLAIQCPRRGQINRRPSPHRDRS